MELNCSTCQSDNTQKLSLLVHGGTMANSSKSTAVGLSRAGLGIAGVKTTGTSVSELAKRYEEPKKESVIGSFFSIFILTCLVSAFAGATAFYIGLGMAFLFSGMAFHHNRKEFPRLHAEWDKKYICLRCSNVFIPNPTLALGG